MPIGLLLLGWGAQKHVHWIVPDIVRWNSSRRAIPIIDLDFSSSLFCSGTCLYWLRHGLEFHQHPSIYSRHVQAIRSIWYAHLSQEITAGEQNAYQPQHEALAAVSCLRCLFAFTFPLFAPYMYNALGYGKGNTILAVVAIVLGCPA